MDEREAKSPLAIFERFVRGQASNMKHPHLFLIVALCFTACATVKVEPVSATAHPIKRVYVLENRNYPTSEVLDSIVNGAHRHGIEAKVINGLPPSSSDYLLIYRAYNAWDLAPFLKHAELELKQGNKVIASASYHHHGGMDFGKFGSVPSKIDPIVDKLFAGFR
jgi:hypothetical protein